MQILKNLLFIIRQFVIAVAIGVLPSPEILPNQKPIIVIIPSYNNSAWYQKNIDMLIAQDRHYTNWCALYVDDCSNDNTGNLVQSYIHEKGFEHKIFVINNTQRVGALTNIYRMIHHCKNHQIIIIYDGDDWFAHDQVLWSINNAYQDPNVWLTYGQYQIYPTQTIGQCEPFPDHIITQNAYRTYKWITSHVRSFYAGLFKKIKYEDLVYNGVPYSAAGDLATMFPMLEMAAGRILFIPDILYIYNCTNPLNDFKVRAAQQEIFAQHIRSRKPYDKIETYLTI
jgi:glycosyltransferase involved in cell wall biosynthesis